MLCFPMNMSQHRWEQEKMMTHCLVYGSKVYLLENLQVVRYNWVWWSRALRQLHWLNIRIQCQNRSNDRLIIYVSFPSKRGKFLIQLLEMKSTSLQGLITSCPLSWQKDIVLHDDWLKNEKCKLSAIKYGLSRKFCSFTIVF